MAMTVGQLKDLLASVPDNYELYAVDKLYGYPERLHSCRVSVTATYENDTSYQNQSVTFGY